MNRKSRRGQSKRMPPGSSAKMGLTLKGCAFIAAVESGLLPEIEREGQRGYDADLFNSFWGKYNKLAEMRGNSLRYEG